MSQWWRKISRSSSENNRIKENEASTSEEVFDSDLENWDEDAFCESPTLVTVDDGKGGIKHIKVPKPLEGQAESEFSCSNSLSGRRETAGSRAGLGLGEMVRKEMTGKHFLSFEPHHEKLRKRIVSKKGHINIGKTKVSKRRRRFLSDIFNTLLDMKWRYVHIIFFFSFIGSWLFFAVIWYIIIYYHGDFEEDHLPHNQEASDGSRLWMPCVYEINNFASVFLFSVETQHTIGYGGRQTTEECPEAIFIMSVQSIVGVMIQACMVGIIFSKLSRPKKRAATLMFSKNAVVCQRDGTNCLLFRVGNMRASSLVEAHVRAILISKKVTLEGEVMPYSQTELTIGTDNDGEEDELFFIWPTTLIHKINSDSPFYEMSAKDFLKKRFEIVVILEGVVEQTGNSIQARSSYLPNEVLWGYRFVNLLTFKHSASEYKIDYSAFNSVYKTELSPLSQKIKDEISDCDKASDDEDDETKSKCTTVTTPVTPPFQVIDTGGQGPFYHGCNHSALTPTTPTTPVFPPYRSRSTVHLYPNIPASTHTPTPDRRVNISDPNSSDNNQKFCVEVLHMV